MSCSKCQCEMRIIKAENVIQNGKLYVDHHVKCINPQCPDYDKVQIISNEQPVTISN